MARLRTVVIARMGLAFGLAALSGGCLMLHPRHTNPLANLPSNQPDKVLFDRAIDSMDHGKYTVARLTLETLLNTYPESEYQARAKLAIADAWYREGGSEGMAQAEAQYKDFITFFPTMAEASEAQLQVAMIHYRQIQKPDRDRTEALRAQDELRTFLINYPNSPLRGRAVQMLRDTQEVLAEGEFRVARFYEGREDYWTAQQRLGELLNKYPLYSRGDEATSMLANSYLQASKNYATAVPMRPPDQRPLYEQQVKDDQTKAIATFTRLVERYPDSPLAKPAAQQLAALHAPVPQPDPAQVAFNAKEIQGRTLPTRGQRWTAMFRNKPIGEEDRADKVGTPLLMAGVVETDAELRGDAAAGPAPSAAALTDSAGAPLQLVDVNAPNTALGMNTAATNTPSAVVGQNYNDPNAVREADPATPKAAATPISPDELDKLNHDAILASEVQRNVPAKAKKNQPPPPPNPNAVAPAKKSFFSRLWP